MIFIGKIVEKPYKKNLSLVGSAG